MKTNWLESKAVSILFFCSAVIFSGLCAYALLLAIPVVTQFVNNSRWANGPSAYLFIALTVMSIPSMILIFFGMAIFCVCRDSSSGSAKVLWFVLFLLTGPIGSIVYYFAVYRGYIKRKRESGAGLAILSSTRAESGPGS